MLTISQLKRQVDISELRTGSVLDAINDELTIFKEVMKTIDADFDFQGLTQEQKTAVAVAVTTRMDNTDAYTAFVGIIEQLELINCALREQDNTFDEDTE